MHKVEMLYTKVDAQGKKVLAGTVIEVDAKEAQALCEKGMARPVFEEEKPKRTRAKKVGFERVYNEENS